MQVILRMFLKTNFTDLFIYLWLLKDTVSRPVHIWSNSELERC